MIKHTHTIAAGRRVSTAQRASRPMFVPVYSVVRRHYKAGNGKVDHART